MISASKIRENKFARSVPFDGSICLAPTLNMYFRFDGVVLACCRNVKQIYGKYPENTVAEIWNGAGRGMLKRSLDDDVFPDGCNACAEQLQASYHQQMIAAHFDQFRQHVVRKSGKHSKKLAGPLAVAFELGTICNYECIMCSGEKSSSIRKNREKLPPIHNPYDDDFIQQLRPFIPTLRFAQFLGGEPFLNRLNFKVWDLLAELNPGVQVHITTNGSILSEKVKKVIRSLNVALHVSVDSVVPANYEAIRGNSSFGDLEGNLEWLIEQDKLGCIVICPMRQNWRDLPATVAYCTRNQIEAYFSICLNPEENSLKYMSRPELAEIVRYLSSASIVPAKKRTRKDGWDVAGTNRRRYDDLVKLIKSWMGEARARPVSDGEVLEAASQSLHVSVSP